MIEDMQIRNLAPATQRAYVHQVSLFARHFNRSPERLGPAEIRTWQLYLVNDKRLAASSIIVAVSALRFLYTVTLKRNWVVADDIPTGRQAQKLPVVLSSEEAGRFLGAVKSLKHRVILTVCYAAGLRISEAVHLKPAAIDSHRMVIRVKGGKGGKDRYVMLSPRLLDLLRDYWKTARPQEWLFPGEQPGQPISSCAVEHACKQALERSGINKPVTPHSLRHAFAVHLLEAGTDPRVKPGDKPAHDPTAARSSQPEHHGRIPAYSQQQGVCRGQSAGRIAHRGTCHAAGPRARLTARPWPARDWKWRMCSAASARLSAISMAHHCPRRGGRP